VLLILFVIPKARCLLKGVGGNTNIPQIPQANKGENSLFRTVRKKKKAPSDPLTPAPPAVATYKIYYSRTAPAVSFPSPRLETGILYIFFIYTHVPLEEIDRE
jgi:hypothetical protein